MELWQLALLVIAGGIGGGLFYYERKKKKKGTYPEKPAVGISWNPAQNKFENNVIAESKPGERQKVDTVVSTDGVSVYNIPPTVRLVETGRGNYPRSLQEGVNDLLPPSKQVPWHELPDYQYALFKIDQPYIGYTRPPYNERNASVAYTLIDGTSPDIRPPAGHAQVTRFGLFFVAVRKSPTIPGATLRVTITPARYCSNVRAISDALRLISHKAKDVKVPATEHHDGPGGTFEVEFVF